MADSVKNSASIPLLKRFSKKTLIIVAGVLLLIIVFVVSLLIPNSPSQESDEISQTGNTQQNGTLKKSDNSTNPETVKSASSSFVYGAWKGQQSVIKSTDISSGKSALIATLPSAIKLVNIISPQRLLYIDQTNIHDQGKRIVRYKIQEKSPEVLVKADPGFGIDDYILSPNKRYMAIWEVSFANGASTLTGGRSRVYTVDLSVPSPKKQLIYDEVSSPTAPVHYAQAVLNDGKVFTDTFLPSSGAGWAYGMSVADIETGEKSDLAQMENGTYGTQPHLSPDGKYLVFAGYDGSSGSGKTSVGKYRQAIVAPNTIEILNTQTLARQKLPNLPNSNIYTRVNWGSSSDQVIITVLSKDIKQMGLFSYSLSDKSMRKINLPGNAENPYSYVSLLPDSSLLMGTVSTIPTSMGNLGVGYLRPLTNLFIQRPESQVANRIPLDEVFAQQIAILPADYFQNVLGVQAPAGSFNPEPTLLDTPSDPYTDSRENLQLRTFTLPIPTPTSTPAPTPTAAATIIPTPTPTIQPTTPPEGEYMESCTELAMLQCERLGITRTSPQFIECLLTNRDRNRATIDTPDAVCSRSPLYLYGAAGQNVKVKVHAAVYNDTPKYNSGFDVKLMTDGGMLVNNQLYQAIDYDYKSNLRIIKPPVKGTVTDYKNLEKVVREYAEKLGLNKKETLDLVRFARENVKSPYVFFSYFDHATSEQILPLSFMPRPDNYLNVVFYFKQLTQKPNYTPVLPSFGKPINRTGFTAVEVSEIVD